MRIPVRQSALATKPVNYTRPHVSLLQQLSSCLCLSTRVRLRNMTFLWVSGVNLRGSVLVGSDGGRQRRRWRAVDTSQSRTSCHAAFILHRLCIVHPYTLLCTLQVVSCREPMPGCQHLARTHDYVVCAGFGAFCAPRGSSS